ncbi:LysR family transcriptional regulator [Lientehia hominis]
MAMTLRHFRILQTVAETGSFTKAAARLYITQSAVSHAIREMEEETGTELFDRLPRNVRLTPCGQLLLEEVTPILASCDTLEAHMGRLEYQAPLRIVSSITIASFWLPEALWRFHSEWPDTEVYVDVAPAAAVMDLLQKGKADLALTEGTLPQGAYVCDIFASYSMKILCAPGYRKRPGPADVKELSQEKLLLREKGSAVRDTFDSALYLKGYAAHPRWTSVNSQALIEAAKAGLGITVLPEPLVEKEIQKGELVELEVADFKLVNELIAVRHRSKYVTMPMRGLLKCVRSCKGRIVKGQGIPQI